ncbi:hypothetical protein SAMN05216268_123139 [Streptomyces yunnanensis]|uniref:Uncharacterized protein n=1 Tax=Streptomyces yunnanensis TaxID=156453 RepID=A0A9X8N743_9ACTN|nr:hypothetical protein SAMN05216268_123139 [Streptomyces yunnanensis]
MLPVLRPAGRLTSYQATLALATTARRRRPSAWRLDAVEPGGVGRGVDDLDVAGRSPAPTPRLALGVLVLVLLPPRISVRNALVPRRGRPPALAHRRRRRPAALRHGDRLPLRRHGTLCVPRAHHQLEGIRRARHRLRTHGRPADRGTVHQGPAPTVSGPPRCTNYRESARNVGFPRENSATCKPAPAPSNRHPTGQTPNWKVRYAVRSGVEGALTSSPTDTACATAATGGQDAYRRHALLGGRRVEASRGSVPAGRGGASVGEAEDGPTAWPSGRGGATRPSASNRRQPSFSEDGRYAPGTSCGAKILFSPGYGLFQLWVSYQVRWFIWAGLA